MTPGNTATIAPDPGRRPAVTGPRHAKPVTRPPWWPTGRRGVAIVAGAVLLAAFAVRAVGLSRSFELWVDEMRYAELGRSVSLGQLPNLSDGPFFLHPPGFFLAEAVTIRLFALGGDSMSLVYELRWLNAFVGAVGIMVLFLIVRAVTTAGMAAVVAVVAMFEPFVLRNNSHLMLETLGTTATLVGILLLVTELRRTTPRFARLAVGGLAMGYGVLTKDVFVVASLVPVLAAVGWRSTLSRRQAAAAAAGVVLPYATYLLVLLLNGAIDDWAQAKWSGLLRMIGVEQDTGFNAEGAPSLLGRLISQLTQFGTSYVLLLACPVAGALACLSRRRERRLIGLAALFMGLLGVYSAAFGTFEENYGYPVLILSLPAAAVVAAELLERRPVWYPRVAAVTAAFLVAVVALGVRAETTTDNGYLQVRDWMAAHLPQDVRVAVTNDTGYVAFGRDPRFGLWPSAASMVEHKVTYILTQALPTQQGYGRATHEMLTWLESHGQPLIRVDGPTNGSTVLWSVPWENLQAGASLHIGESD
ncbi:ArnT family glycosyltransferase [Nakamurella deserti]|uniref:ArnT family glycosyltransferase n=1 Tax=Nakamurella deserti TaxID=2164074 RepID=UPI000DBE85EA|nr:hypothetical protein [Nakamurella deserti]